jgi:DnaJ family protein C protein 11
MSKSSSLETKCEASTNSGVSVSVGTKRTVFSRHNTLGLLVRFNVQGNIMLQFRASRYAQTLSIPLILSHEWNTNAIIAAIAVPALSIYCFDKLLLKPFVKRKLKLQQENLSAQKRETAEERKKDALEAIELMRATAARRMDEEQKSNGLVILQAWYGSIPLDENNQVITDDLASSELVIEVTVPIQVLVNSSLLQLPDHISKVNIMGFYDPCPWIDDKKLFIRYHYKEDLHEVLTSDTEGISAPMRIHRK